MPTLKFQAIEVAGKPQIYFIKESGKEPIQRKFDYKTKELRFPIRESVSHSRELDNPSSSLGSMHREQAPAPSRRQGGGSKQRFREEDDDAISLTREQLAALLAEAAKIGHAEDNAPKRERGPRKPAALEPIRREARPGGPPRRRQAPEAKENVLRLLDKVVPPQRKGKPQALQDGAPHRFDPPSTKLIRDRPPSGSRKLPPAKKPADNATNTRPRDAGKGSSNGRAAVERDRRSGRFNGRGDVPYDDEEDRSRGRGRHRSGDERKTSGRREEKGGPRFGAYEDEVVDSVMQRVLEENKDKMSEEELVDFLAKVYLEIKKDKDGSASEEEVDIDRRGRENRRHHRGISEPDHYSTGSEGHKYVEEPSKAYAAHKLEAEGNRRHRPSDADTTRDEAVQQNQTGIMEKKRLQWQKEREELEVIQSYNPWGRPGAGAPPTPTRPGPSHMTGGRAHVQYRGVHEPDNRPYFGGIGVDFSKKEADRRLWVADLAAQREDHRVQARLEKERDRQPPPSGPSSRPF